MSTVCLYSLLLVLLPAEPQKDDDAKKELDKLQGDWTIVAMEVDGKPVPEDKLGGTVLTIKKDRYTIKVKDQTFDAVIKLDPAKKPRHIDITFLDGENKDKTAFGIYLIDGDTLKICRARLPDKDRPGEFATWPDSDLFVVTWKKK